MSGSADFGSFNRSPVQGLQSRKGLSAAAGAEGRHVAAKHELGSKRHEQTLSPGGGRSPGSCVREPEPDEYGCLAAPSTADVAGRFVPVLRQACAVSSRMMASAHHSGGVGRTS